MEFILDTGAVSDAIFSASNHCNMETLCSLSKIYSQNENDFFENYDAFRKDNAVDPDNDLCPFFL